MERELTLRVANEDSARQAGMRANCRQQPAARGRRARVKDLAAGFQQSRPAISKHLKLLSDAELVVAEPAGRERVYRLQGTPLQQVSGWLAPYRTHWQVSLDNLKDMMEKP